MPEPRSRGPDLPARLRRLVEDGNRIAEPPESSRLRVEYLWWLVETHGPLEVASRAEPPGSFQEWVAMRENGYRPSAVFP